MIGRLIVEGLRQMGFTLPAEVIVRPHIRGDGSWHVEIEYEEPDSPFKPRLELVK